MAESNGWWYDRRKKIYTPIDDHAKDVIRKPDRYRLDPENINIRMAGELGLTNRFRDQIIPMACAQGFIRVRLIKGHSTNTLGWQFTGEPHDAFAVLKRFAQRRGVGPMVEVTFTDFGLGRNLTTFWSDFDPETKPLQTFLKHWELVHAPTPMEVNRP